MAGERIDQCWHCTVREDMQKCMAVECNMHESWFGKSLVAAIAEKDSVIRLMAESILMTYGTGEDVPDVDEIISTYHRRTTVGGK